jgi:DNA-binding transcriptional MocR family regulator
MEWATSFLQKRHSVSFIPPEGGFFLTLRLNQEEEYLALGLLRKHHFLTHPGYFYDMSGNHLVFSFVSRPGPMRKALQAVIEEIPEGQTG